MYYTQTEQGGAAVKHVVISKSVTIVLSRDHINSDGYNAAGPIRFGHQ